MSAVKHLKELGREDFDRLLSWLDADRERAGQLYEKIRRRLVMILAARGCPLADELADETIDRVARRVVDIQPTYVGDKAIYFLGVMNNVHHEFLRRPATPRLTPVDIDSHEREQVHVCLDKCLDKLAPYSRRLIERYYAADKKAKIDLRKLIARELGLRPATLRIRALRIREKLQTCIEACVNNVSDGPRLKKAS
ncbi:MAG TPA: hypothetical protein VE863_12475 [Pyrinomonadaceae bacterium]|nr:hypothetical protein [Pyrinomonadaceae bacterium]